jgi:hypothetical protein
MKRLDGQMGNGASAIDDRVAPPDTAMARRNTLGKWGIFVLIGIALYFALYAWSEHLIQVYGEKNRFFMVSTAPAALYDDVILGASHAMPFGFADMNERLEQASGARILNLSVEGAGILPNRLLLDYFFARHGTRTVVFFVDSFAFYSTQWNEERINDAKLFVRAPFDIDLVRALWRYPWARPILPSYASGFLKINNGNRFAPDISDGEAKFTRTYRPIAQIDRQRLAYLYPATTDPTQFRHYRAAFADLIGFARQNGADFIVVKPPTPARYRDKLPDEAEFDATMRSLLDLSGVPLYDLSTTITDDRYFYDTDHLNRDGVIACIDRLAEILRQHRFRSGNGNARWH